MDIIRAKELLEVLADGVNPLTGEVLPANDSCNQAEIVRALHAVLKQLDEKPEKSKKKQPENAGKPWTKEDEELLTNLYNSGTSKKDICHTLKRSVSGVAARLVHLGLIDNRDIFRDRI